MQAATNEAARTALGLLPTETLIATIKAHIAAGEREREKAEAYYNEADIYLAEAKELVARTKGETWPAFVRRFPKRTQLYLQQRDSI
jgi:hypothetical protein